MARLFGVYPTEQIHTSGAARNKKTGTKQGLTTAQVMAGEVEPANELEKMGAGLVEEDDNQSSSSEDERARRPSYAARHLPIPTSLWYEEMEYDVGSIDDETSWQALVKRIEERLWSEGQDHGSIGRLDFAHVARIGGDEEVFEITDTSTLQEALHLFREAYAVRHHFAKRDFFTEMETCMRGDDESKKRGAKLIVDTMKSTPSAEVELKMLQLLTLGLQECNEESNPEVKAALEHAALAFVQLSQHETHAGQRAKFSLVKCLLGPQAEEVEAFTEYGATVLMHIALTASGARIIVNPDTLPGYLLKIHATEVDTIAEVAAGAVCRAVTAHGGMMDELRLSSLTVILLAKLLRRHKSWEVKAHVSSILAAIARHVYAYDPAAKLERSKNCEDDLAGPRKNNNMDDASAALSTDDGSKHDQSLLSADDATLSGSDLLDSVYDSAVMNTHQSPASKIAVGFAGGWRGLLSHHEVFLSALSCAESAAAKLLPGCTDLAALVPKEDDLNLSAADDDVPITRAQRRRSTLKMLVKPPPKKRKTSAERQQIRSALRNILRTTSKANKQIEAALSLSTHVAWATAFLLKGDEEWVTESSIRTLLALALMPLTPYAVKSATMHCAATLERLCARAKFARLVSEQRGIVHLLRMLLERDEVPFAQCCALRVLQAVLEVSEDIRDELVLTNFRAFLAGRLTSKTAVAHGAFSTLGAHMLATLTKLTIDLLDGARVIHRDLGRETPTAEDDDEEEYRRCLVRSTNVGMSNYMRIIVLLLNDGPPASLRYTSVHLWLLARVKRMREDLVRNHVIAALIPRVDDLVRVICAPHREAASLSVRQRRLARELDEEDRESTLNQIAATVWILVQSQTARAACARACCVELLVRHVIELHGRPLATARRLLTCSVWQLAHGDPALATRLVCCPLVTFFPPVEQDAAENGGDKGSLVAGNSDLRDDDDVASAADATTPVPSCFSEDDTFRDLLIQTAEDATLSGDMPLMATRFLYYLVEFELRGADFAPPEGFETRLDKKARLKIQALALKLLEAEGPRVKERHEHGALMVAKEATTTHGKAALVENGAVEKLVGALRNAGADEARVATNALHALFNLSTHDANQVRIIKVGFSSILKHARGSFAGAPAVAFATRILENCRHQPAVVSTYYKCELKVKAGRFRPHPPATKPPSKETPKSPRKGEICRCDENGDELPCEFGVVEQTRDDDDACCALESRARAKMTEFKSKFDTFLEGLGGGKESEKGAATASYAMVTTTWSASSRAQLDSSSKKRMPKLNSELSRSVVSIWGKHRPASGLPETPKFSPRVTWSPRITQCAVMDPVAETGPLLLEAAQAEPRLKEDSPRSPRLVDGTRQTARLPSMIQSMNAGKVLDAPNQVVSSRKQSTTKSNDDSVAENTNSGERGDSVALCEETLHLQSPRVGPQQHASPPGSPRFVHGRRAKKSVAVDVEGRKRFVFNKPIEQILKDLEAARDRELEDEGYIRDAPVMAHFPHVEGSKFSEGLFEKFELPDGTGAYFYYRGRGHAHFVRPDLSEPATPAEDLQEVLGDSRVPGAPKAPPLAKDDWPQLFDASKVDWRLKFQKANPFGISGVSTLVQSQKQEAKKKTKLGLNFNDAGFLLLKKHKLACKARKGDDDAPAKEDGESCCGSDSDDSDDSDDSAPKPPAIAVKNLMRLTLTESGIVRVGLEDAAYAASPVWRLQDSIVWLPRVNACAHASSPRAYVHSQAFWAKCAACDWAEIAKRTRFLERIRRLVGMENYEDELVALQSLMAEHYALTNTVYHYFAAKYGSSSEHTLGEHGFKQFAEAAKVPDRDSKGCNAHTVGTTFIEANIQESAAIETRKKAQMGKVARNSANQIVRFEFYQALILLANAKYLTTGVCELPSQAFEKLLLENVASIGDADPSATAAPDAFRVDCLYKEDVDAILAPHVPMLKLIYATYNPTTAVKKRMVMKDWNRMLSDARFFDEDFTRHEAKLTFVAAQMKAVDGMKYFNEFISMSATDFIEGLCRVAMSKTLPSDDVLLMDDADLLDVFDTLENLNDDPKRAIYLSLPPKTQKPDVQDLIVRLPKLLFLLYRRLGAHWSGHGGLLQKCFKPGSARAMAQLRDQASYVALSLPISPRNSSRVDD